MRHLEEQIINSFLIWYPSSMKAFTKRVLDTRQTQNCPTVTMPLIALCFSSKN